MPSTGSPAHRRPSPAAILAVPVIVAIVLTLFAWPSARLEPRDLPIGVAGPAAGVAAVEQQLTRDEGAFEVHHYADESAARSAIEDREIYGAVVAAPEGGKVLTSSAGSPMVAQLLARAASEGHEQELAVEDVVPAGREGNAISSSVLPLVIAGILTGLAAATLSSTALGRTGLLATGAILGGMVATAIVQSWLDVVDGDWWANAAGLSLTIAAISAAVAGGKALLGNAGVSLAAMTMMFVGNPFSAVGTAPELLPQPVGGLGQLLPPGAGGNLLRSTGFFDGADAGGHVAVLATWVIGGLALLFVAALRDRKRDVPAVAIAEPVAA